MNIKTFNNTDLERTALIEALRTRSSMAVIFRKADGTLRTMNCTLKDGSYPALKQKDLMEQIQPRNSNVICVYDLDKQAWRSFRLDSVKEVSA
jgi:WYL_2, Sm-like SH3 beta-barrel fold